MSWFNSDGLLVKFGTEEGVAGIAGTLEDAFSSLHEAVVYVNLLSLGVTPGATSTILDDNVFIPKNARLQEIEIINITAATSAGSPTLDVGLIKRDRTTELDYNGILAAQAMTSHDAAGETTVVRVGSAGAGALLGTTLTDTGGGYIVANYNTAAYTAGRLRLAIRYFLPSIVQT